MALADQLQSDIAAVLDSPDFGRDVTLRQTVPGTYDPSTGATAAATVTDFVTRGLLLAYQDKDVDGTLIKAGDRKCILKVQNLSAVPVVGNMLIVGSDTYTVMDFKTYELGGTVFLYNLHVRRGGK